MTSALWYVIEAGVALMLAWFTIQGLRTGTVRTRGSEYRRATAPFTYWLIIAGYSVACLAFAVALVLRAVGVAGP